MEWTKEQEPWKLAGMSPKNWLVSNFSEFNRSQSEIISSAAEYLSPANCGGLENDSGVYFLIYKDQIVYVGKANQLFNRLKQHWKAREKAFDSYYAIQGPIFLLEAIEEFFIEKFKPPLNGRVWGMWSDLKPYLST